MAEATESVGLNMVSQDLASGNISVNSFTLLPDTFRRNTPWFRMELTSNDRANHKRVYVAVAEASLQRS